MDKIKTKQKVFGMGSNPMKGEDWCAKDEKKAIGEKGTKY